MGVLDAFNSTWSKARQTFGQGTPQDGTQFDASANFQQAKAAVEAATAGPNWQGPASEAYAAKNKDHAAVFGRLADLDKRMAAEVTNAANVVTAGRQNLDQVKSWVTSAVSSIPSGTSARDRDKKLLQIANAGISKVSNIVQTSTGEMNAIGGRVQAIKGEFQDVGNEKDDKKDEKNGDVQALTDKDKDDKAKAEEDKRKEDTQHAADDGRRDGDSLADGHLTPEERQRLTDAINVDTAALDHGDVTIPPEQMAYLNGLSDALDGKSPSEIRTILDGLPPEDAKAVSNALHLVGSEHLRTEPVDASLRPGDNGYVPTNGGKDNLPQSIRDVFDDPLLNEGVPPGPLYHPEFPYRNLDEYRDIAAISRFGDPAFQRGSAINEGLLAQSREMLEDYGQKSRLGAVYGEDWAHRRIDPALQDMLSAASNDPEAVHDIIAGADGNSRNDNFIHDLNWHDWADGGTAAGTLLPDVSDHSERAGQTVHAFDSYVGEHYQELLNMGGREALGQVNPALVQALSEASVPYLDDMSGHVIDDTKGFSALDAGGNANNLRGLFAVIDSNQTEIAPAADGHPAVTVASKFNTEAANVWQAYVADYSDGLAHGDIPRGEALQAAGKLQGAMDMGEYIHQLDEGADEHSAAENAWKKRGEWFDGIHDVASLSPHLKGPIGIYDNIPGDPLRSLFVGDPPETKATSPMPLRESDAIVATVGQYLASQNVGDLADLRARGLIDESGHVNMSMPGAQDAIEDYVNNITDNNDRPFNKWIEAYGNAIYASEGEFDKIKPPEK
ncbi:TPR repeat region-containing protein [Mycolicibacterium fortuitum]